MTSTYPGLVVLDADGEFSAVLARLERAFAGHGITPLARFDHSQAAAHAGLRLAPTTVFVFGDPHVGTPLMQEAPTLGLDLPLKIAVVEQADQVKIVYHDPRWVCGWHGLSHPGEPAGRMARILGNLAAAAADQAGVA